MRPFLLSMTVVIAASISFVWVSVAQAHQWVLRIPTIWVCIKTSSFPKEPQTPVAALRMYNAFGFRATSTSFSDPYNGALRVMLTVHHSNGTTQHVNYWRYDHGIGMQACEHLIQAEKRQN